MVTLLLMKQADVWHSTLVDDDDFAHHVAGVVC